MTSREMNGTHPTTTRPPHHHQHHHQQQHHRSSPSSSSSSAATFKGCCCCLFFILTFLGLLVIFVVLFIIFAVKPKKPQFELQQVAVQYVGISSSAAASASTSPSPSSASLSLTIRMVFTAVNPNKVGIKYAPTRFYVMYRGVPLGLASVPAFYQPSHSVRQLHTTVAVDRVNLLQTDATDLLKDATLNDRVELRVTGDVAAKIRILDLTSPRVKVSVDCVIVISPRRQSVTYKQCGVDGLSV